METKKFQIDFSPEKNEFEDVRSAPSHLTLELEELEEADQYKHIYACFGLAAFKANLVEQSLINCFIVLRRIDTPFTRVDLDELEKRLSQQTLGSLLKRLRERVEVAESAELVLREALEKRNHLIHHFFAQYSFHFVSLEGRRRLVLLLNEYVNVFTVADQILESAFGVLQETAAIPDEYIQRGYDALMARAKVEPFIS